MEPEDTVCLVRRKQLDSDEEAEELFAQMEPISEHHFQEPIATPSKREAKAAKRAARRAEKERKAAKRAQKQAHRRHKLKKIASSHSQHSEGQGGSSEYSSETPVGENLASRLLSTARKSKMEAKEGFKLEQLGNDAPAFDEDQAYSDYSQKRAKKSKKSKKNVISNEQLVSLLKDVGVASEEESGSYDNGMEGFQYFSGKKSKRGIRVKNKLFEDLSANQQEKIEENIELELQPVTRISSIGSFMSRVELLKRKRGMEGEIEVQAAQILQENAKKSLGRIVQELGKCKNDVELEVRAPCISKGKSAQIVNNTYLLKGMLNSRMGAVEETKNKKEKFGSLQHMVRNISSSRMIQRSQFVSQQEIQNCFRKTDLLAVEEARKKIEEKRIKKALLASDQSDGESAPSGGSHVQSDEGQVNGIDMNADTQQNKEGGPVEPAQQQGQINEDNRDAQEPNQQPIDDDRLRELLLEEEQAAQVDQESQNSSIQDQENKQKDQEENEESEEQNEEQNEENEEESEDEVEERADNEIEQGRVRESLRNEQAQGCEKQDRAVRDDWEAEGICLTRRRQVVAQDEALALIAQQVQRQAQTFQQFRKFRKLRQTAERRKQRQEKKAQARQFHQEEAEEGSDNEDHDELVKPIDYAAEQREEGAEDLDADLQELIDDAVEEDQEAEEEAFRKYIADMKLRDREEIKMIQRGQFRKQSQAIVDDELDEDERDRRRRMEEQIEWINRREEEQARLKQTVSAPSQEVQLVQLAEESEQEPIEQQKEKLLLYFQNELTLTAEKKESKAEPKLAELPTCMRREIPLKMEMRTWTRTQPGKTKIKKTTSHLNELLEASRSAVLPKQVRLTSTRARTRK